MNPIILINSCKRDVDNGNNQAQRDTCFREPAIPYRFILGRGNTAQSADEVVFDVPDDYESLAFKVIEGHRWALAAGYDFIFQGTTDTYCFTDIMLASGFEQHDYTGWFIDRGLENGTTAAKQGEDVALSGDQIYASGGSGYWLSPKASQLLIQKYYPGVPCEDMWTGMVLSEAGLCGTNDFRYHVGLTSHCTFGVEIPKPLCTIHLSTTTGVYDCTEMYEIYKKGVQ